MARYIHKQEVWDAAKCAKLANKKGPYGGPKGTGHHPKHYAHGRIVDYNGGTVIDGIWYSGEEWPLPVLAAGFTWELAYGTWGPRIVKEDSHV